MDGIYSIIIFASLSLRVLADETTTSKPEESHDRFVKILEGLGLDLPQDSSLIQAPSFLSSLFKQDGNEEGGGGIFEKIAQPLQGGSLNDMIVPVLPFLKNIFAFVAVPMGLEALSLITLVPVMTRAVPGVIDYFFSTPRPQIQYRPVQFNSNQLRPTPYYQYAASNIRPSTVYPPPHISNIERPYRYRDWSSYSQEPPNRPQQGHKIKFDHKGYKQSYNQIKDNYSPNNYSPNSYSPNNYSPYNYSPNNYSPNNYSPNDYSPNNYNPAKYQEPKIRHKVHTYENEYRTTEQAPKYRTKLNRPEKVDPELTPNPFSKNPIKYFNKDSKDGYFHVPVEFDNWHILTANVKNSTRPSQEMKDRLKTIADMTYKQVANRFQLQGDMEPFVIDAEDEDTVTHKDKDNTKRKGVPFEATTDLSFDDEIEQKYGSSGISYTEYEIGPLELAFKMNKS